ncbi:MAG: signal peptidase I [Gammaproteobacteria bacterium]
MDLSGIFTLLLAGAGMILLVDRATSKQRRRRAQGAAAPEPLLVQYARAFFPVIMVVLLVRAFVFEPFRIPSASMMPGLVDGDFIFVDKFSYGLRLPVINTKIVPVGEPRRGDVIVFRLPADPSVHFIKRLIGLPGDHVVVRDNHITINGVSMPLLPAGTYAGGYGFTGADLAIERFGTQQHVVMLAQNRDAKDFEAVVPARHYFFMGDNRNDSEDSRFSLVGFVPEENLVGHAVRIWMNWQIPGWPDWRRIGMKIR